MRIHGSFENNFLIELCTDDIGELRVTVSDQSHDKEIIVRTTEK